MSSPRVTSASIEALVFDFLVAATDEILQERRGICNPITHSSASFKDNSDYCKQSLLSWRRDITTPLILDLYIFDPRINKHILMERWKFLYQRANDLKDTSQLLLINHRVGTLLRSLHSFVRLLPGFNLINISQKLPTLSFQLYEQKNTYPTGFVSDISRYNFDPISTSKGLLYMSVKFMTQPFVKDILVNVNGGSGHSRRNSRTAEENSSSAAIPIPSKDSHNTDTGAAYHGGKHMNARTITPSTSFDPTAENSSAESTGTLGSASGGVSGISGSTPPLGNRYGRTSSRDRELHRRSFQLPSHAENEDNSGGTGVENASFPPQPQSQHAGSLDSNSGCNTQQYMNHHSTDGHHHNQPTSGRVQSLKLTSQNFAGAPDGTGYGIQITNSHGTATTTGGTSYGNSYSLTSTPPFSLSELAAQQTERYGRTTSGSGGVVAGSNPESSQSALSGASPPNPPFPAFSCSLTSTSPHMGGNMLAWLDKHGQGGVQGQQGGGCGALQAYEMHHRMHHARSGSEDSRSYFLANAAARGDRLCPASGLDFSELKLKIAPLPCSPFLSTSQYREGGEMSGSHSTALVCGGGSSSSHYTHGRSNSISGGAGSTKSESIPSSGRQLQHSQDEEDNTLDSVRMHESQRMSLDNADSSDLYAFRNSLGSESEGRVPSKDRHSDGTDPDLEHCLDVELPFAWAESDMAGNAVPRPASVTGDSLGAQLVYGLSKMSLSSSPFTETSNNNAQLTTEQAQSYHNTNTGTREGYSPSNRTSSSYTGAGLSGELLGKINEYKNFNTTFTK